MTEDFDLTTWEDRHKSLLAELDNEEAAARIATTTSAELRRALATGDGPPLELLSGYDILTTDWPEPPWAIPDLLPIGLAIFAGKAKLGKSWMALQIALSIASGGMALNQSVPQGRVLYLALEDTERRLKDRMQKQGWTKEYARNVSFMRYGQFVDEVGDLKNGGGEILARQIKAEGFSMVFIDTLAKSIFGDQNDVGEMTRALAPLQEIAQDSNSAIQMIDHHNKLVGSDALDAVASILGSTAKGAISDTIWGLYRERGKSGAKLAVTGRDIDEKTLEIKMDWETGVWQVETGPDGLATTRVKSEMIKILTELGPTSCTDLATAMDRDRGNTYKDLTDLVNIDQATKTDGRPALYSVKQ